MVKHRSLDKIHTALIKDRPISVISVFSRMLGKVVHNQLTDYFITNKVLTTNQSAFRKLYTTVTSLISSTDYSYENIDKKQLNFTIFLDFKKAFDIILIKN